jgi:CDP-diacylglycerol--serine O-phosphatidyltransferase
MTRRRRRDAPLRRFIPNLVTIFGLCVGLMSVRAGMEGRYTAALYLIIVAVFLDAADGKVARYLKAESDIGAELDTLSDFFNFGIAPTLLIYNVVFAGTDYTRPGWFCVLVLTVCCALRLARFNVALTDSDETAKKPDFFVGVPAPAMACLALMPMLFRMEGWHFFELYPAVTVVYLICIGLLAVSTIPTFSIKRTKIRRDHQFYVLLAAVGLVMCLTAYPWLTLITGNFLYLASIPVSFHVARRAARVKSAS